MLTLDHLSDADRNTLATGQPPGSIPELWDGGGLWLQTFAYWLDDARDSGADPNGWSAYRLVSDVDTYLGAPSLEGAKAIYDNFLAPGAPQFIATVHAEPIAAVFQRSTVVEWESADADIKEMVLADLTPLLEGAAEIGVRALETSYGGFRSELPRLLVTEPDIDWNAIDTLNKSNFKPIPDGASMHYVQFGSILLIGDGHDPAIVAYWGPRTESSSGDITKSKAFIGAGSVEVTGCLPQHQEPFLEAFARVSEKAVSFEAMAPAGVEQVDWDGIDEQNKANVNALTDGQSDTYVQYGYVVLVGGGHTTDVSAWADYGPGSSGQITFHRKRLGSNYLEVTGCRTEDQVAFTQAIQRFRNINIDFGD